MIVNTAYPYMEKIAPANPVIFEKNVVNYSYQGSAQLQESGFYFKRDSTLNLYVSFYNVNCKKQKFLSIVGTSYASGYGLILTVTFIKNSEQTDSTVKFMSDTSTKSVEIPTKYQTSDVTIKFSTSGLPASLLLRSAKLS